MRLWHLLPIALPAAWGALTFLEQWPAQYKELLANPLVGVGAAVVGLAIALVIDLIFNTGFNYRMPTERELQSVKVSKSDKTLIEGVTPISAPTRGPPPEIVQRYGHIRVPMPDEDNKTPAMPQ